MLPHRHVRRLRHASCRSMMKPSLPFLPVLLVALGLQCAGKLEDYKFLNAFGNWFDKSIFEPIVHDPLTFLGLSRAWRYSVASAEAVTPDD